MAEERQTELEHAHPRPRPRPRHAIGLAALLLFTGYFGVWRGYVLVESHFGAAWAVVVAIVGVAGLCVIAAVGLVVIRTMRRLEGLPPPDTESPGNNQGNGAPRH